MKKDFFDAIYKYMDKNLDIYLLFVGLGYPRFDEFKKRFGDRAINTEASEQTALDMAVGLAYSGKIPVVYSITPFLLYRGFETWRTYINHENLHVIGIGAGRDKDYSEDGFSHHAIDDGMFMEWMNNVNCEWPKSKRAMRTILKTALVHTSPTYINLIR